MPIYEYQCGVCGHQLEAFQNFSDAPLTECPECHKPALSKLMSATSFQLKGTGWYATDFRDKGKKPVSTTEGSSGDAGKSEGSGASDSTDTTKTKSSDSGASS